MLTNAEKSFASFGLSLDSFNGGEPLKESKFLNSIQMRSEGMTWNTLPKSFHLTYLPQFLPLSL